MIRNSARLAAATALALLFSPVNHAFAQDQAPATPTPEAAAPAAPAAAPVFPAPDPADFTATAPTKDVVNAFMQANLGFDANSMWQVQAIQKTQIAGISKVVVFVGDKTGKQQPYRFAFFTMPDEKHIIVGERDRSLRRASLRREPRRAPATRRRPISRISREGSRNRRIR